MSKKCRGYVQLEQKAMKQRTRYEEYDDHNQPTEPMSAIILSPGMARMPGDQTIAPPSLLGRAPETPAVYPVLPPSPLQVVDGRPAGGAPYPFERVMEDGYPAQARRSAIPSLVGVFFVAVQLLLLIKVGLLLFGIQTGAPWFALLTLASGICAWPFRWLLQHVNMSVAIGPDIAIYLSLLLAILAYGLLARLLVRFLKALLHSR